MQVLSQLVVPGGTILSASSSAALVHAHAVQRLGLFGSVNVMLVNEDPSNSYAVTVSLQGAKAHGFVDVFTYGIGSTSVTQSVSWAWGSSIAITVPPYSLTTLRLL
jgi:hypothetical protein